jgi:hypothetical protein
MSATTSSGHATNLALVRVVPIPDLNRCSNVRGQNYSITSSASRRNGSGIISPSAFAVLRLIPPNFLGPTLPAGAGSRGNHGNPPTPSFRCSPMSSYWIATHTVTAAGSSGPTSRTNIISQIVAWRVSECALEKSRSHLLSLHAVISLQNLCGSFQIGQGDYVPIHLDRHQQLHSARPLRTPKRKDVSGKQRSCGSSLTVTRSL